MITLSGAMGEIDPSAAGALYDKALDSAKDFNALMQVLAAAEGNPEFAKAVLTKAETAQAHLELGGKSEAARRRDGERCSGPRHRPRERGEVAEEVLRVARDDEELVEDGEGGAGVGRNGEARLREEREEADGLHRDRLAAGVRTREEDEPLDDVPELANVPGPVVFDEPIAGIARDASWRPAQPLADLRQEGL